MMDEPQNHEFRQQLAALTFVDQLSVLVMIRLRLSSTRRRSWVVIDVYPVVHMLG